MSAETPDSAAFNQIPQTCLERGCPLTQAKVDKHGIVLTLGCDGPSLKGSDPTERVVVDEGKVSEISPTTQRAVGRKACTNLGFDAWLEAIKSEYDETRDT